MILILLAFIVFFILFMLASNSMGSNQNAAKYAFFYMLSLVAMIFTAISVGTIIFQVINKTFPDPLNIYQGSFSAEALRFAISSLVIAAPIFFLTMRQISKSLFEGTLNKDSSVRKWLTYFILFVAIVVMIGWLVGILNSFLNGELTVKFFLKALTSILISASIFTYYLYDIRRPEIAGIQDKTTKVYFYGSLVIIVAALVTSFFFIESPTTIRQKKHDRQISTNLDQIDGAVGSYFASQKTVPEKLEDLYADPTKEVFISREVTQDPASGKVFDYKAIASDKYEICANFELSNQEKFPSDGGHDSFLDQKWPHEAGYKCFTKTVTAKNLTTEVKPLMR